MDCCQCHGIEEQFDHAEAARKLREYRRSGPARTTRLLLDELAREGVAGLTLLDIGGGIGAIQHALLKAGAAHATDIDASTAYLAAAREEASRQGHARRGDDEHLVQAPVLGAGENHPRDARVHREARELVPERRQGAILALDGPEFLEHPPARRHRRAVRVGARNGISRRRQPCFRRTGR